MAGVVADDNHTKGNRYLSMLEGTHLQYHPQFSNGEIEKMIREGGKNAGGTATHMEDKNTNEPPPTSTKVKSEHVRRRLKSKSGKSSKSTKKSSPPSPAPCDPADVRLLDYPQWQEEKGYWIGEYTFLQGNGDAFVSSTWNYPYDHYKGFITGEVSGNAYRQRNVFLYPPQLLSKCSIFEMSVVGDGECGMNGNTKVFQADQSATTCSSNEELDGDIQGLYIDGPFALPTTTELVGKDNALLYQVFIPGVMVGKTEDVLLQSQLTTITKGPNGEVYRTRSAQSFDAFAIVGTATSASYYRERRVEKEEFYEALNMTIAAYSIRDEDLCVWDSSNNPISGVSGSFQTCQDHLEESFLL